MLEFSVSNQLLTRLDAARVYSDSENYLECAFQFSDDWEGLEAVATFGHGELDEPISVRIVDGVCRVPHEVIHPYGFTLAVYGTGVREDETVYTHIPTNVVTVEVGEAGAAVGLSAPAPTPNLYDSLMDTLQEKEESALAAKLAAETAAATAAEQASASASAAVRAESGASAAEGARLEALESAGSAQQSAELVQTLANAVSRNAAQVLADGGAQVQAANEARLAAEGAAEGVQAHEDSARLASLIAQYYAEGLPGDFLKTSVTKSLAAYVPPAPGQGSIHMAPMTQLAPPMLVGGKYNVTVVTGGETHSETISWTGESVFVSHVSISTETVANGYGARTIAFSNYNEAEATITVAPHPDMARLLEGDVSAKHYSELAAAAAGYGGDHQRGLTFTAEGRLVLGDGTDVTEAVRAVLLAEEGAGGHDE